MSARLAGMIGSKWAKATGLVVGFLCLAAAAASHGASTAGGVLKVRFGGDQRETRVVVELNRAVQGKLIDGDDANLVTISLPKVEVAGDLQGSGQGLVKAWTVDDGAGAARLKLELTRGAVVERRFLLPPGDGVEIYRYVIDLKASDAAPATLQDASTPTRAVIHATPIRLKKVIVIDAGHGGKDPGARGSGTWEKDVNLAAAKALKARLERSGRYRVVMTRDSDVFVPLETRVQIARRADADLFISLHSDSGPESSTRGATVYTLSDSGSDRVAKGVMSDNWFINVSMPGHDTATNRILLDLTQRTTRNQSSAFAEDLLSHVSDSTTLLQRSHRDAGFVVLLAPDVPAVLLEMGFISNHDDEKLLNDPARRKQFMGGVGDAIDAYFEQQNTRVASR